MKKELKYLEAKALRLEHTLANIISLAAVSQGWSNKQKEIADELAILYSIASFIKEHAGE